jgi:UDP:flavonoid glycosyltransferase YjiC (YdhE family)
LGSGEGVSVGDGEQQRTVRFTQTNAVQNHQHWRIGNAIPRCETIDRGFNMPLFFIKRFLLQEFKDLVDKSKAIVVMSFGSVANATRMPESWKKAFIGAFKRFPEHDFNIRYDIDDLNKIKSSNVHLHKWLPQTDLLRMRILF